MEQVTATVIREVFSFKNLNNVVSFSVFPWGLGQVFKGGPKSLLTNKPSCLFSTGRRVIEDIHVAGQVFLHSLGLFCISPVPALSDGIWTDLSWSIGKLFIISGYPWRITKIA